MYINDLFYSLFSLFWINICNKVSYLMDPSTPYHSPCIELLSGIAMVNGYNRSEAIIIKQVIVAP